LKVAVMVVEEEGEWRATGKRRTAQGGSKIQAKDGGGGK
jgi:hypothetical protein